MLEPTPINLSISAQITKSASSCCFEMRGTALPEAATIVEVLHSQMDGQQAAVGFIPEVLRWIS